METQETDSAKTVIATLRRLRQVRQFSDRPVPQAVVEDILEVARWTASGGNAQPWEFVVIHNHDTLRQLAQGPDQGSFLAGAQLAIVIVMAGGGAVETYDEGRLGERMMLAAAAHGVGAGIWWIKDGGVAAKRILGIPEDRHVRSAISFGYPAESTGAPTRRGGRKPLSELVHEERY